ncbi:MAG: aminomethyl-transferring glycine dehydrogenase subunit GcvPA [Thermoplasmatota archaeon]
MGDMLDGLDLDDVDDLFADIPEEIRIDGLDLPPGMTEQEVERHVDGLLDRNRSFRDIPSFLGGGIQPHYVPAAVEHVVARSEFLTSYTPYQPEVSQGILQAMFEYQSVVCELTGMDAANVSMYDAATALGEAAGMVARSTRGGLFLIPKNLAPEKKSVLSSYLWSTDLEVREIPAVDGRVDLDAAMHLADDAAGVYLENPNYLGLIENRIDDVRSLASESDVMLVVSVDPLLAAVTHPPSTYGADIVVGDGWFGSPMNYGGVRLGMFACKRKHVRQMPGRIIGATSDSDGKRAFCMTMQTREQHIRRERATSNICTNQALAAVAFAAYAGLHGAAGLQNLAAENMRRARYTAEQLADIGFTMPYDEYFFNEFVAVPPIDAGRLNRELLQRGIHGGLPLRYDPDNALLYGVTEMHTREMIDGMIAATADIVGDHHV